MFFTVALFMLVAVVAIIFLIVTRPSSKFRTLVEQIPGPPTVPLFGNVLQFKTDGAEFHQQLHKWNSDYGRDSGIIRTWLGRHVFAILTKAETAEVLLNSSKFITKSFEYEFTWPWLNTGLLNSSGDKWYSRRKLITPTFHFKILEDFLQVFNEQTSVLHRQLDAAIGQKTWVELDISRYITLCALDIICDSAMGKHVNAQENSDSDYVHAVYKMSELIMKRFKSPWLWSDGVYHLLPVGRLHRRLLRTLHDFTDSVIRERQMKFSKRQLELHQQPAGSSELVSDDKPAATGTRKRLAFLDMLLYSAEAAQLKPEDIREEVDTFMFEGHDTTSAAVNWAIHLIGADQNVQSKLHRELDDVFETSDRPATTDDIKKLEYMECVIKESLRLFPSVPLIARKVTEDCNIGGFILPEGSTAVINISEIHRDPRRYPDPEVFNPDRWLTANSADYRHPFAYIPFSAGQRNCIGQKFAMMEEKVMLSTILRHFRIISLQTRDELMPVSDLILRPKNGIKVRLERR